MSKRKKHESSNSETKAVKTKTGKNNELKIVLSIITLGFILRMVYVFETTNSPFYLNLFSDSKIYFDWANKMFTSGDWVGDKIFFMSPGYPYFLAFLFQLFGSSILAIRIVQVIISSITIFIIYKSAENIFGQSSAIISAFVAASYDIFIFYSGAVLGETIQVLIISVICFTLSRHENSESVNRWFKIGIMIGIAALFRANILLAGAGLLIYLVLLLRKNNTSNFKPALFLIIGIAIPVLIVTARNYFVGKDLVMISSNGGINFYIGNNENALGVYVNPKGFEIFNDMPGEKYAQKISGQKLMPSEVSSYWYNQGLAFIVSKPIDASILMFKKILFYFGGDENPQSTNVNIDFFRENYSNVLKLPLINFQIILLSAITGIYFASRNKKKIWYLISMLFAIIISTIIFFVIGRFRLVAMPIFIIFSGYGFFSTYQSILKKEYSALLIPAGIISFIIVMQFFFIPKYNYLNFDVWNNLADAEFQNKHYDAAISYAQKSISIKENEISFYLLANCLAAKGDFNEAIIHYNLALKLNSNSSMTYFNRGLLYAQQGIFEDAVKDFYKTIEIDPMFGEAYRNLAVIQFITENYEQALKSFNKYLTLTEDEQAKYTVKQDIIEIEKRLRNKEVKK